MSRGASQKNYSSGHALHHCQGGVDESQVNNGSVYSYTSELAKYITCASTIRARVKDMFGHSPDVATIKEMQEKHKRSRDRFKEAWNDLGSRPNDGLHWAVNGIKPKPEKPKVEPIRRATLPREVIAEIARHYGVTYDDVVGRSRKRTVIKPRRLAAYVLVSRGNSNAQVGRWLGGRDHTTVIFAIEQFQHQATEDERKLAAFYIGDRCK